MSKNSKDRFVDTFVWKASSERDAVCNQAWRILRYRKWAKHTTAIPAGIGAFVGAILGLSLEIGERSGDWFTSLMFVVCYGFVGVIWFVMWRSVRKSEDPMYDWAEEWTDLIEERRAFRREEYEQDLPRRKF